MLLPPSTSSSSPAVPSSIYAAMRQRINMRQIIMQGNLILMLPNLVAVAAAAQHCEHLRSPCGGSIVCQAGNILPHLGLPLIAISMIIITIYSPTIAAGKWFGEYYGTVPKSLQETDRDQWPPPALLCTLRSLQRDLTLAPQWSMLRLHNFTTHSIKICTAAAANSVVKEERGWLELETVPYCECADWGLFNYERSDCRWEPISADYYYYFAI